MQIIEQLNDEIIDGLSTIAGIEYCGQLLERRDQIRIPAIVVDLVELEPDTDPGTMELALISHWEARLLVSDSQEDTIVWCLILEIMLWLYQHNWPVLNIGKVNLKSAAPDHFSPSYQGQQIWLVEWTQKIRVGESVWDGDGVIPDTACINWQDGSTEEIELPTP